MPSTPVHFASALLPLILAPPLLLHASPPSSARVTAAAAAVVDSTTPAIIGASSQKHVRRGHDRGRRHHRQRLLAQVADGGGSDDESFLPVDGEKAGSEEWYLPDVKVQFKRTWLFGAGDPTEWGGSSVDDRNSIGADTTATPVPIEVPSLLDGEYVVDVSAGGLYSAILTNEGRILTAGGASLSGALGRDTADGSELGFAPVTEVYPWDARAGGHSAYPIADSSLPKFVKVAASQDYTIALDEAGNIWSTGNNAYGQLCLNDTSTRDRFHQVKMPFDDGDDGGIGGSLFNRHLQRLQQGDEAEKETEKVVDVALGERHTILLREDGTAWGCGWNQYGQMGIGSSGGNVQSPTEIIIDGPDETVNSDGQEVNHDVIVEVVAGRGSSYFLTSSGHIFAVGTNYKGQLCLGHREDMTLPVMLDGLESMNVEGGVTVKSIMAGASSLYLLLSNGVVMACGENIHGQLGIGSDIPENVDVPTPVANMADVTEIFSGPVSLGAYFVSNRTIYAVGFDGSGAHENWNVPNMMACADEGTSLEESVLISSGNDHTLYLATAETTLECEGASDALSAEPSASLTTPPEPKVQLPAWPRPTSPQPTWPRQTSPQPTSPPLPPTTSPATGRPTNSGAPTVTGTPTGMPTVSSPPSFTTVPSSLSTIDEWMTDVPTPFMMMFPPAPTISPSPTKPPSAPTILIEPSPGSSGASDRCLTDRFRLSLLGAGLLVWQWA